MQFHHNDTLGSIKKQRTDKGRKIKKYIKIEKEKA